MTRRAGHLPDTNLVLRYLLRDVPEQFAQAEQFFEAVRSGAETAVILESVLVECVYVLMKFYKVPKPETTASLIGLMQYKGIANRDRAAQIEALEIFAGQNLDVVDCMLLAKAKAGNLKVASFDKALKNQAEKMNLLI